MRNVMVPVVLFILSGCLNTAREHYYKAGFKTVRTTDRSRVFKSNTDTFNNLHYRPLDIDIWYPAKISDTDTPLPFRIIMGLLEERANYYSASNSGKGIGQQITQFFCDRLKCSDSTEVLNFKTQSFKNAAPVNAKFPVVIYLSAFNGMSYENFPLFEKLAENGFVVVSISSIGRYPGDMTMKKEDLMEQVNDAIASLNTLKQSSNINISRIGIIGYSWGGLTASILASKIPNTRCVISLEGSEFHHYGQEKEENTDFDRIRYSKDFKDMQLSVPYLRLESSAPVNNGSKKEFDSIYNFTEKLAINPQIFQVDSAQHEDFGCLPYIVNKSGHCRNKRSYETILRLTLSFLDEKLNNEMTFSKTIQQEMNNTIRKN